MGRFFFVVVNYQISCWYFFFDVVNYQISQGGRQCSYLWDLMETSWNAEKGKEDSQPSWELEREPYFCRNTSCPLCLSSHIQLFCFFTSLFLSAPLSSLTGHLPLSPGFSLITATIMGLQSLQRYNCSRHLGWRLPSHRPSFWGSQIKTLSKKCDWSGCYFHPPCAQVPYFLSAYTCCHRVLLLACLCAWLQGT